MKKKTMLQTAGIALAAAGAVGLAGVSSPAGQEVMTAVQNTQVVQRAPQQRTVRTSQPVQFETQARHQVSARPMYMPALLDPKVYGYGSLPPKEYGLYLSMSGKNKYNKRKALHLAKAFAK